MVIHGTDDKVLPLPHAQALHDAVDQSKLVVLEGVGHEIHPDDWGTIAGVDVSWAQGEKTPTLLAWRSR